MYKNAAASNWRIKCGEIVFYVYEYLYMNKLRTSGKGYAELNG